MFNLFTSQKKNIERRVRFRFWAKQQGVRVNFRTSGESLLSSVHGSDSALLSVNKKIKKFIIKLKCKNIQPSTGLWMAYAICIMAERRLIALIFSEEGADALSPHSPVGEGEAVLKRPNSHKFWGVLQTQILHKHLAHIFYFFSNQLNTEAVTSTMIYAL